MSWLSWQKLFKPWHGVVLSIVVVAASFVALDDFAWMVFAAVTSMWALAYLGFLWAKSAHASLAGIHGKLLHHCLWTCYWFIPASTFVLAIIAGLQSGYLYNWVLGPCINPVAQVYAFSQTPSPYVGAALCASFAGIVQVMLGLGWAHANRGKTMLIVGLSLFASGITTLALILLLVWVGVLGTLHC